MNAPFTEQTGPAAPVKKKHAAARVVLGVVGALIALALAAGSVTIIPEGHVGVKVQLGRIVQTGLSAGVHMHMPFFESIDRVDTREQMYESTTNAYTRDTQTVEGIESSLNYYYVADQLDSLIRTVGISNVETRLIVPQVNSILKNAIGKFKAEELVQNRSEVQEDVESALREALVPYGIYVSAFNIRNIDFEDGFEDAVRLKVETEQKAQTAQNETVLKEEQARQAIIAAQAEADAVKLAAEAEAYAIRVINEQLAANPAYIELQRIQQWDGHFPQIMGESVNPFVTISGTMDSAGSRDSAGEAED